MDSTLLLAAGAAVGLFVLGLLLMRLAELPAAARSSAGASAGDGTPLIYVGSTADPHATLPGTPTHPGPSQGPQQVSPTPEGGYVESGGSHDLGLHGC